MTKEELKKESEEWVKKKYPTLEINAVAARYCKAYLAGAEPREKRIAELEKKVGKLEFALENKTVDYDKLEKENAELNNFIMQSKKDGISPINALIIKNLGNQLTKATEIIKKFSEFVNNEIEYDPEHPQEHTDLWNKLCEQVEQFLKDIKEG